MSTILEEEPISKGQGSVWSYVSPGRLALFCKCPLAIKLRYVDGIRRPMSPALFLGKQVHAGLESHYRHRMLGTLLAIEDVVGLVINSWDQAVAEEHVPFVTTDQEFILKRQAVDLIQAYISQVPADKPKPLAVEAAMEVPLVDPVSGEDLGIPLLDVVDLILDYPGGPVIADFKTNSKASPPYEVTHELQLSSYAWLFRQVTGGREAALEIRSLIKTKVPKVETHAFAARSSAHFRRLFATRHLTKVSGRYSSTSTNRRRWAMDHKTCGILRNVNLDFKLLLGARQAPPRNDLGTAETITGSLGTDSAYPKTFRAISRPSLSVSFLDVLP